MNAMSFPKPLVADGFRALLEQALDVDLAELYGVQ